MDTLCRVSRVHLEVSNYGVGFQHYYDRGDDRTVCAVKTNSIVLETGADRVRIELMKWAISSKGIQVAEDEKASEREKNAEAKKKK